MRTDNEMDSIHQIWLVASHWTKNWGTLPLLSINFPLVFFHTVNVRRLQIQLVLWERVAEPQLKLSVTIFFSENDFYVIRKNGINQSIVK